MNEWVDVCLRSELPPGSHKVVAGPEEDILVVNADGVILAVTDQCTHQELPLSGGSIDGDIITCPWHHAEFCLKTGEALSAPAYEPVGCHDIQVIGDLIQVAALPREA